MKTAKRIPVEPDVAFIRGLKKAQMTGEVMIADGINICPPTKSHKNWRIKKSYKGTPIERSGGLTATETFAAYLEVKAILDSKNLGEQGLPENSNLLLKEVLETYLNQGGKDYRWKPKTRRLRRQDFNHLLALSGEEKLHCSELRASHLRDYLKRATKTQARAKHLKDILGTFIRWGQTAGYFTDQQTRYIDQVAWTPPKGSNYQAAPNRRRQSQLKFGTTEHEGGQVPTHEQVIALAKGVQQRYTHGYGLILVSCNMGSRANETLIYTADRAVHDAGLGNYVDCEEWVVLDHWQYSEETDKKHRTTKTGKMRAIVIPPVEIISSGFNVREFLKNRSDAALKEQAAGVNPLALIFPSATGKVLNLTSFGERTIRPACESLGWKMGYEDADGKVLGMYRFTIHSLRDRYGTTAAQEWGYSDIQLLEQGGWSDLQTVRKYYIGTTDDTYKTVRDLHEELAKSKKKGVKHTLHKSKVL